MESFSSKLIEHAVNEFSRLPGIGKKTALRLTLHLLKLDRIEVENFGNAFIRMRQEIRHCSNCHNISDEDLCSICLNPSRDQEILCVVEDMRDVIAIENTQSFKGKYHILGGIISPMEGIGPKDLNIDSLINKATSGKIREIIMALSTTMEGDTTNFYIYRQIRDLDIKISIIARGISIGDELEYADEVTLGRSIANRILYEETFTK